MPFSALLRDHSHISLGDMIDRKHFLMLPKVTLLFNNDIFIVDFQYRAGEGFEDEWQSQTTLTTDEDTLLSMFENNDIKINGISILIYTNEHDWKIEKIKKVMKASAQCITNKTTELITGNIYELQNGNKYTNSILKEIDNSRIKTLNTFSL